MIVICTFSIATISLLSFENIKNEAIKIYVFALLCLTSLNIFSQTLTGTVKDTLSNPIQNVNIIAEPQQEGNDLKFSITDHLGRYRLMLEKDVSYKISVSYIGFYTVELEISADFSKNEHNFILKEKEELLDEIVIKHKPIPVFVKKDTITYDINYFKNGKEFKMIEILEKLPGFEIEDNGTIKVHGKEVSKVLVENKPFFGGSTKLAIENIPADALDRIEIIDNFNEVDFLKEVSDSNKMILNVKLKEDKKKFIFGDIEAASEVAGDDGYYSLHAALFSYSQKTNLSYIGNLNNIGSRSFSFEDLMRFQNVGSDFISKDNRSSNLYSVGTGNTDVVDTKSQFSALNLSFEINPKLQIDGYGIFSKLSTTSLQESKIQYLRDNSFSLERRTIEQHKNELLGLGNFKLNYVQSINSKIIYNLQFQNVTPKGENLINSIVDTRLSIFKNSGHINNNQINQFFEWHKRYNLKNMTTLAIDHNYENNIVENTLFSNNSFLNDYLTYQADADYNILQNKRINSNNLNILAKHYWIINNLHHLYIDIGNSLNVTNLETLDQQVLSDGSADNIFDNDFDNRIEYSLNNFYVGLEYKFKRAKWENKLSLFANSYNLISKQRSNYQIRTFLIEPIFNSDYQFNPTESLKFEYKYSNNFPIAAQLLEQFTILNYNSIYKGNVLLRNEKFHNATLDYSKHNLYKGLILYVNATFNKKTRSIRNSIGYIDNENFITPEMINTPESNIKISGMIEKQIHKFKISIRSSFSSSEYLQTINNISLINQRNNQNINLTARTADKKLPLLKIQYRKSFSQFYGFSNSTLVTDNVDFSFNAVLFKNFNLKTNYEIVSNKNQYKDKTNYQIANASFSYRKRNKPFSFELSAQNYLNNAIKIENRFSDYLISNNRIYTLPRIIMFSIRYKI